MNRRRFLSFLGMCAAPVVAVAGASSSIASRNPLASSNAHRLLNPSIEVRWSSPLPKKWNMGEGFWLYTVHPERGTVEVMEIRKYEWTPDEIEMMRDLTPSDVWYF